MKPQNAETAAFPTGAKEREKEKRRREKEEGVTRKPKKKARVIEDHFDDCGGDLSPLDALIANADAFYDEEREHYDLEANRFLAQAYPLAGVSSVADAQPGPNPYPDQAIDPRAPRAPGYIPCPACRANRLRMD